MDEITSILESFSKKYKLWEKSKQSGFQCLKNSLEENLEEFSEFTSTNFVFKKASQNLVFFDSNKSVPFIRTTLNLFLNQDHVGYYSLDVNKKGNFIEDWLVFY